MVLCCLASLKERRVGERDEGHHQFRMNKGTSHMAIQQRHRITRYSPDRFESHTKEDDEVCEEGPREEVHKDVVVR